MPTSDLTIVFRSAASSTRTMGARLTDIPGRRFSLALNALTWKIIPLGTSLEPCVIHWPAKHLVCLLQVLRRPSNRPPAATLVLENPHVYATYSMDDIHGDTRLYDGMGHCGKCRCEIHDPSALGSQGKREITKGGISEADSNWAPLTETPSLIP